MTGSPAPGRSCGRALRLPALWDHHAGLVNLAPEVLPIVCFCVLVLAPRRRAPDLRRLAWLLVPATLVAAAGPPPGRGLPAAGGRRAARGAPRRRGGRRAAADGSAPGHRGRGLAEQPRDRRRGRSTTTARSCHGCSWPRPRWCSPSRSRERGACCATRPSSRSRGFTNSEPFPGLWLGAARDAASRSLDHQPNSPGGSTMRTSLTIAAATAALAAGGIAATGAGATAPSPASAATASTAGRATSRVASPRSTAPRAPSRSATPSAGRSRSR